MNRVEKTMIAIDKFFLKADIVALWLFNLVIALSALLATYFTVKMFLTADTKFFVPILALLFIAAILNFLVKPLLQNLHNQTKVRLEKFISEAHQ